MKKLFILVVLLIFTAIPGYADDDIKYPNEEEYIPEAVHNILTENGINSSEEIEYSIFFKIIPGYIKDSLKQFSTHFYQLIVIITVLSVFKRIYDNSNTSVINSFVMCAISIDIVYELSLVMTDALKRSNDILKAWLPSFSSVTLLGGGTASSATAVTSFSTIITLIEIFLNNGFTSVVIVCGVLSVFEQSSKLLSELSIVKHLKKGIITVIGFSTTLLLSALTFQNVLASRSDCIALRTVKFASANFIPIIGNAVGEAIRTVSSGVSYLKSSLGVSAVLSLFFVFAPCIVSVILCKLLLRFIALFSTACGCNRESSVLDVINDISDIMLSIIICVLILSILLVVIFVFITFGV